MAGDIMLAKPIAYSLPTKTVGITAPGATTITVQTVGGHIPSLTAGEYTYGILSDDETFTDPEALYETVKITAITGSDLTVERNAESTHGAQEWPDGTAIMVGITAVAWSEVDSFAEALRNAPYSGRWLIGDTLANALVDRDYALSSALDDYAVKNEMVYTEKLLTSTDTGTVVLNLQNSNVFEHTVDADTATTFQVSNASVGAHSFTLVLHQHTAGPAITWDFTVHWPDNTEPDVESDTTNVFTFFTLNEGTLWYGHKVGSGYGSGV